MTPLRWLRSIQLIQASAILASAAAATPQVFEWERGFGLRIPGEPAAEMRLWIYEWNMFEAMNAGQHTHGTYQLPRRLAPDGTEGVVDSPQLHLAMRAVPGGAELSVIPSKTAGMVRTMSALLLIPT
jgi:hypothetical protein